MPPAPDRPVLLTASQAASLLGVSDRTIRRWMKAERIPSLKLASGEYRIAQGALLPSLRGTYDVASELRQLEEKHGHLSDEAIAAALGPHLAEGAGRIARVWRAWASELDRTNVARSVGVCKVLLTSTIAQIAEGTGTPWHSGSTSPPAGLLRTSTMRP